MADVNDHCECDPDPIPAVPRLSLVSTSEQSNTTSKHTSFKILT
jgi:hypothetical protein